MSVFFIYCCFGVVFAIGVIDTVGDEFKDQPRADIKSAFMLICAFCFWPVVAGYVVAEIIRLAQLLERLRIRLTSEKPEDKL